MTATTPEWETVDDGSWEEIEEEFKNEGTGEQPHNKVPYVSYKELMDIWKTSTMYKETIWKIDRQNEIEEKLKGFAGSQINSTLLNTFERNRFDVKSLRFLVGCIVSIYVFFETDIADVPRGFGVLKRELEHCGVRVKEVYTPLNFRQNYHRLLIDFEGKKSLEQMKGTNSCDDILSIDLEIILGVLLLIVKTLQDYD